MENSSDMDSDKPVSRRDDLEKSEIFMAKVNEKANKKFGENSNVNLEQNSPSHKGKGSEVPLNSDDEADFRINNSPKKEGSVADKSYNQGTSFNKGQVSDRDFNKSSVANKRSVVNHGDDAESDDDRKDFRKDIQSNRVSERSNQADRSKLKDNSVISLKEAQDRQSNVSFANQRKESGKTVSKKEKIEIDASVRPNEREDKDMNLRQIAVEPKDMTGKKTNDDYKLFVTEKVVMSHNKPLFSFHDLIVPGGKNAKLVSF